MYRRDDIDLHGVGEQLEARYDQGFADLDVAGKVSLDIGPVALAPYMVGKLPTGDGSLEDLARFEFGAAATFTILQEYFALHANIGGFTEEEGLQGFRYRIGASVVPFATDFLLVRIYGDELAPASVDLRIMGLAMLGMCVYWANPLFVSMGRPLRATASVGLYRRAARLAGCQRRSLRPARCMLRSGTTAPHGAVLRFAHGNGQHPAICAVATGLITRLAVASTRRNTAPQATRRNGEKTARA